MNITPREITINRQWLAREWLFLLAGMLWAFIVLPILVFPILAPFLPWRVRIAILNGDRTLAYGPYVLLQIVRVTKWAIRTLRESPK